MNAINDKKNKAQFDALLTYWLDLCWELESESCEKEINRISTEMLDTESEITAIPAPDIAAVATKFEIATHDGRDMLTPLAIESITSDLRRLVGFTVSPIFQPKLWLSEWQAKGGSWIVKDGVASLCCDPGDASQKSHLKRLDRAGGAEVIKAHILANYDKVMVDELTA
jgi:hypothetical protein